jgi:hypothetical protein
MPSRGSILIEEVTTDRQILSLVSPEFAPCPRFVLPTRIGRQRVSQYCLTMRGQKVNQD